MSRETLMAAGTCLVVAGIVLRGFARSSRRDQALRKQRDLQDGSPPDSAQPDALDRHLERFLPRYAAGCIIAGLVLIVAAFLR